jgi:hypothetical protein
MFVLVFVGKILILTKKYQSIQGRLNLENMKKTKLEKYYTFQERKNRLKYLNNF